MATFSFCKTGIAKYTITNHHFKWWFALTLKGYGTSLGLSPTIWSANRVISHSATKVALVFNS